MKKTPYLSANPSEYEEIFNELRGVAFSCVVEECEEISV